MTAARHGFAGNKHYTAPGVAARNAGEHGEIQAVEALDQRHSPHHRPLLAFGSMMLEPIVAVTFG